MTASVDNPLNDGEKQELTTLEFAIEKNLRFFFEVGIALMRIRDRRLYRAEYATFEEYCRKKWDMGRAHACRLIDSAGVMKALSPMGDKGPSGEPLGAANGQCGIPLLPQNERQVRPLLQLNVSDRSEVWENVIRTAPGGKVTARLVTDAVKRFAGNGKGKEDRDSGKSMVVEGLSQKLKAAFERLLHEIQAARDRNWETISKVEALGFIERLNAAIAAA